MKKNYIQCKCSNIAHQVIVKQSNKGYSNSPVNTRYLEQKHKIGSSQISLS